MKAFVVDDEPIAIDRLRHLLEEHPRVAVVGSQADPAAAIAGIRTTAPDVLFLDIEMPGMSGFELLETLGTSQPLTIFTTAYERYALDAFRVNSIDYLLKPIERAELTRALAKLDRIMHGVETRGDMAALLEQMRDMLARRPPEHLVRVPSRTGSRVDFVDLAEVTYFYAKDKLVFAATTAKHYALDLPIADLEVRLDPRQWLRIHRATIVNVRAVKEVHTSFGGRVVLRLKDGRTDLTVPRDRVADVKAKLGV
jgi:two-component system, LytTR family, response regulator